ncbi:MAG: flagellar protein export ATPase FliI [Rhizobiales bacterium]|nr:flagellar protein export ATPase FliI [Hyphomicrobiales bacterium]
MSALSALARAMSAAAEDVGLLRVGGVVVGVTPGMYHVAGLSRVVALGDLVSIETGEDGASAGSLGEVVRIDPDVTLVKPFERDEGAALGHRCWRVGPHRVAPHESWLGRVVDALGRPIDGAGPMLQGAPRASAGDPPAPLARARVGAGVRTGVRALDVFAPLVEGQRIGVFAGSGVGKSTLLAMLARASGFDAVVVALVGERGREVRDTLEESLAGCRARATVVVATADESAMMRRLAPRTAVTVAEHYRACGRSVLLIVDSITRYAHALRETALSAGEPPVARGYPPSVFSDLPRLLERVGPGAEGEGAITGVFSVLVDGDDHNDPVADAIRGALDGHIVLSRAIADEGRFPAIDILRSLSRLAPRVWSAEERKLAQSLRAMIARFEDTRDLRLMGGYQRGGDAELDRAVTTTPKLYAFCAQTPDDAPSTDAFRELAAALRGEAGAAPDSRKPAQAS